MQSRSSQAAGHHSPLSHRAHVESLEVRTLLSAYPFAVSSAGAFPSSVGAPTGGEIALGGGQVFGTGSAGNGTIWTIGYGDSAPSLVGTFPGDGSVGSDPVGVATSGSNENLYGLVQTGVGPGGAFGGLWELPIFADYDYLTTPVLLASFNGINGETPGYGIYFAPGGALIGTSIDTLPGQASTIWELPYNGTAFTVLAQFPDGELPSSSLVADASGNLWGTTSNGGTNGVGTLFELQETSASGTYSSTINTMASFGGVNPGTTPQGQIAIDSAGNIVGTTLGVQGSSTTPGTVWVWSATSQALTAVANFAGFTSTNDSSGVLLYNAALYGSTGTAGAPASQAQAWEVSNYTAAPTLQKLTDLQVAGSTDTFVSSPLSPYATDFLAVESTQLAIAAPSAGSALIEVNFVSTTLPSQAVPGDTAVVKLEIEDVGLGAGTGVVDLQLYASPDGALDDATVLSAPTLAHTSVSITDNKPQSVSGHFTIPSTLAAGTYSLVATATIVSGLANASVVQLPGVSTSTFTDSLSFGTVGTRHNLHLVQTAVDGGKITYSLSGPGTGTLTPDSSGDDSLTLTGTTAASSLSIAASGAAALVGESLDSLTIEGNIGTISGPRVSLSGALTIQGSARTVHVNNLTGGAVTLGGATPTTLELGALTDASIISTDPLTLLQVADFTNTGAVDTIIAPTIGTLSDADTLEANIATGKIGTLLVKGSISHSVILAGANFGPGDLLGGGDDTFAAGAIGTLRVLGSIDATTLIAAGLDDTDDAFPLDTTPQLLTGGKIGTIYVRGSLASGGQILAASLPKTGVIGGVAVKTF
jgi:uncharacterized repeat protein (TIGR03803 family)